MRSAPLALIALLTAACSPRPTPSAGPCDAFIDGGGAICAEVTWLGGGAVDVRLVLDPRRAPGAPEPFTLRFREAYVGADHLADRVRVDPAHPWPAGPVSARATVRYRVTLPADRRHDRYGVGGISFTAPGGWQLVGRDLIPDVWRGDAPAMAPSRLYLESARPGETPVTPAGPGPLDSDSAIELADRTFAVGRFATRAGRWSERPVTVATAADAAPLDGYLARVIDGLGAIEQRLGPYPGARVLVMHHALDAGDWGTSYVETAVQSSPRIPTTAHDRFTGVLVHELVHLWWPGRRAIPDRWMAEGLTDYVTLQVMAAATDASPRRVARLVERAHRAYAAGAEGRTVADGGRDRWSYDAGIVVGYCLDGVLAEAGAAPVSRAMAALIADADAGPITADRLRAALAAAAPAAGEALDRLISTRGPIDLAPCLARGGFARALVEAPMPTPRAVAVDTLRVLGLTAGAKVDAFRVEKTAPGASLAAGDVITTVAGEPVADLDDVALALRALAPGDDFEVIGLRDGHPLSVALTLPTLPDDQRPVRRLTRVVPLDGPAETR